MKPSDPCSLKWTSRHGQMTAFHSIRDFFDLVVELITNSDDSYHNQYIDGAISEDGGRILLEIEPRRGDKPSIVRVRDRAAGFENMARKIEHVGEKTSSSGDRGFMARGLKDCAALGRITIETIIDGRLDKAEITTGFELIPYRPNRKGGDKPSKADRERLGIPRGNGTVVEVALEPRITVPRHETLRRDLPWHLALRDITDPNSASKLLLRYAGGDPEVLLCTQPDSDLIHDREYEVPNYPNHRFRFKLWRAHEALEAANDRRFTRTGIVVKGRRAIHACSFLASELERDPAADHYFGRIECNGIDAHAEEWDDRREQHMEHPKSNPTFILDPNRRAGLADDHPFIQALYQVPIAFLKDQFERDRKEKENKRREIEAKETTQRLRRLAREASRFMREQMEDLGAASPGDVVNDRSFHKTGIGVTPVFTQIAVGTTKTFTVKVDNERLSLPFGTIIRVSLSKAADAAVDIVGSPTELEPDPVDARLLKGTFNLKGKAVSRRVQVGCHVDGLDPVFVEIQVISGEPEDLEIPNDLAFHRKIYTVRLGGRRTLVLRARSRGVLPTRPQVRVSNESVAVIRSSGEFEHVSGTSYHEATFIIEGRKPAGKTTVQAKVSGRTASCRLNVVEKEEEGVDLKFRLVDHDLGVNYRAVWDRKAPNTLLITTRHESIRRYLGSQNAGYPGQHGEPFRVLLAELISDNVCRRIVEEHVRAQPHAYDSDKVYLLHNKLMKQFTPIAHQVQLSNPSLPKVPSQSY